jgi:hypothetical protein
MVLTRVTKLSNHECYRRMDACACGYIQQLLEPQEELLGLFVRLVKLYHFVDYQMQKRFSREKQFGGKLGQKLSCVYTKCMDNFCSYIGLTAQKWQREVQIGYSTSSRW